MFIFLWNYGSIGIHSYEPSGSKAIEMISCLFPLKCRVYESIPMNQLALKEKNPIKSYHIEFLWYSSTLKDGWNCCGWYDGLSL